MSNKVNAKVDSLLLQCVHFMANMAALSSLLSYTVMLLHISWVIYGNLPRPAGSVRLRELVSGGATLFFLLKCDKMLEDIFFHRYLHLLGRR